MRNTLKITLALVVLVAALLLIPNICNAAYEVSDATELTNAINEAKELRGVQLITLTDDIVVEGPNTISVGQPNGSTTVLADIVIDGQGQYTITGAENWTSTSGDQSMFTAHPGVKLTLKNVTLQNGPKYGVQAYDGGSVVLDNVRIDGFDYGAVLNNGGTVTVKDLDLGLNGKPENGYNGIEMGKGDYTVNNPSLVMDGTITSDQSSNVVNIATNDNLTSFTVENGENAVNKIAVAGNKVVITDENNTVVYTSNEPVKEDGTTVAGSENGSTTKKYVVSIDVLCVPKNNTVELLVEEGTVLDAEELETLINIPENYSFDGFYADSEYTTEFDFTQAINADTEIFAIAYEKDVTTPEDPSNPSDEEETTNPSDTEEPTTPSEEQPTEGEKDETPKTGVSTYIGVAAFVIVASVATMVVLKKKNS